MTVLCLEGIGGTGKSTLQAELVRLGWEAYVDSPELMQLRRAAHRVGTAEELYQFYLYYTERLSRNLGNLKSEDKVVLVRYWPSLLAYHGALGVTTSRADLGLLVEPDLYLHLHAHPAVIRARLNRRDKNAKPNSFECLERSGAGLEEAYRRNYEQHVAPQRLLLINSGIYKPEEIAGQVIKKLAELRQPEAP